MPSLRQTCLPSLNRINTGNAVTLNDFKREQDLKGIGFTVLRFDDNDVLNHIDDVSYQIRDYIIDFKKRNGLIIPL